MNRVRKLAGRADFYIARHKKEIPVKIIKMFLLATVFAVRNELATTGRNKLYQQRNIRKTNDIS